MLLSLDIRDMALIRRQELRFMSGLNVLTGETGAGKSILLDCLGFVLGWKTRADIVRQGAVQGEVTAVFEVAAGHPVNALLVEAGLGGDAHELVLRRTVTVDGRRTAFVNDRRAGADTLRRISDALVELHGQHDDTGLLDQRGHRRLLDAFAGTAALVAETRSAWTALGAARAGLAAAQAEQAALAAEEDFLRHAVSELDALDPRPGEDADLDTRRRLMQASARVREDVARALQALGPEGAEGQMSDARRWLDAAAGKAEGVLDRALEALERAITELGEAAQGVERGLEALSFDPQDLERCEERLFAIRGLARKHAVAPDDLGTLAETLRGRLATLDGGASGVRALQAGVEAAGAAYALCATALSAARHKAAGQLDAAMAAELPPLKLEKATFCTDVGAAPAGPEGQDTVSFTVSTGPGLPAGPIDRIASGGELSRFLLALKVCLSGAGEPATLIFDEIDRGVGGATADAVGRRLARLAVGAQVLVVTHSPQVAARGRHHWRVEKQFADGVTLSGVTALAADDRIEEIARMLAGDQITDAARDAARALLAG